jgi:hypothetical protein
MSDADKVSVQRLLQQFEHEIVDVNRCHIGEITGEIGKNDMLKMGEAISICRARYLKAVLDERRSQKLSSFIRRIHAGVRRLAPCARTRLRCRQRRLIRNKKQTKKTKAKDKRVRSLIFSSAFAEVHY